MPDSNGSFFKQYLFEDKIITSDILPANYDSLDFISDGCRLYGEILYPDSSFQSRPCVFLLHGYPGTARNDDIAHALCRAGCVVIVPHFRGAWGSEGSYLVSHCVEDTVNLVAWTEQSEFILRYHTVPGCAFLIGHSMGGSIALNAAKLLTAAHIRGLCLIAPFDAFSLLSQNHSQVSLEEVLFEGKILHSDGVRSIYDDIAVHPEYLFDCNCDKLSGVHLLAAHGELDPVAPVSMTSSLLEKLSQDTSGALRRSVLYPGAHGLLGCRMQLIHDIAAFISDSLS